MLPSPKLLNFLHFPVLGRGLVLALTLGGDLHVCFHFLLLVADAQLQEGELCPGINTCMGLNKYLHEDHEDGLEHQGGLEFLEDIEIEPEDVGE